MYMDDSKLFAKNERELKTRVQIIGIYSQNIGIDSVIKGVPYS